MKNFFKLPIKIFITGLVFLGIHNSLNLLDTVGEYIWELMILSFLVGTFILSIRDEHVGEDRVKSLSKVGFRMVISSIIILIGHGFGFVSPAGFLTLNVIRKVVGIIVVPGLFLLCYSLLELIWELSKNAFSKK